MQHTGAVFTSPSAISIELNKAAITAVFLFEKYIKMNIWITHQDDKQDLQLELLLLVSQQNHESRAQMEELNV